MLEFFSLDSNNISHSFSYGLIDSVETRRSSTSDCSRREESNWEVFLS